MNFDLERGGVIFGLFVDEAGEVVSSEQVSLHRVFDDGRTDGGWYGAAADAQGNFRFEGIPAGRYILSDSHPRHGGRLSPVFYPGVKDAAEAEIIEIPKGGAEVKAVMKLPAAGKTFATAGRFIDGDTGRPLPGLPVARAAHGPQRVAQ